MDRFYIGFQYKFIVRNKFRTHFFSRSLWISCSSFACVYCKSRVGRLSILAFISTYYQQTCTFILYVIFIHPQWRMVFYFGPLADYGCPFKCLKYDFVLKIIVQCIRKLINNYHWRQRITSYNTCHLTLREIIIIMINHDAEMIWYFEFKYYNSMFAHDMRQYT